MNGNHSDAAAHLQGTRRFGVPSAQSNETLTRVGRSQAGALLPRAASAALAAVPSPPAFPPLPAMLATASSLDMSSTASLFSQFVPRGVFGGRESETDSGDDGSDVPSVAMTLRTRRSTGNFTFDNRHRGGPSNPSHRAPRALSGGKTQPQGFPNLEAGGRRSYTAPDTDAVPSFRNYPCAASSGAGPVAGLPASPSTQTTLAEPGAASTPAATFSALLSRLSILNTPTAHDTSSTDTRAPLERAREDMSLLPPAVDFHGLPATPQHDQKRPRQQLPTVDQQGAAQNAGAATKVAPDTPNQRQLSISPHHAVPQDQRADRHLSLSSGMAVGAVLRMTDHRVVEGTGPAAMRLLQERRTELPSRDTEAHGEAGRAGADSHRPVQVENFNTESVEDLLSRSVAQATPRSNAVSQAMELSATALAFLQQVRISTTEERRVRYLFHSRPRLQLTTRPLVVANAVLDRARWEQPLCYPPLCIPCMRNTVYSVPLSTVMRTSWESDFFASSPPSVTFSDSRVSVLSGDQPPRNPGGAARIGSHAAAGMPTNPAFYHVPATSPWRGQSGAHNRHADGESFLRGAPDASANPLSRLPTHLLNRPPGELLIPGNGEAVSPLSLSRNCGHLLYRCFCVRCAIASQAQALQTDAEMRASKTAPFPCCACLGVESKSQSAILCRLCVLDLLTLGIPFGCCCYHGLGSALHGWHLRYMLRARYRIFAWTAVDLLIMCCIPGLALDQQGAELLLNGIPESTVGLQFMT
ncbi:hypothetical protein LSCM4_06954 [Leishmania orientalis]|uniref:Uncharacterized protein n=1 Tax=Leishmania orientalis TaxID=2249476 RepID=A0A836H970_9TRYP|nr:hypothetical protein LSCM4_06954 [Leishmania orientalis]